MASTDATKNPDPFAFHFEEIRIGGSGSTGDVNVTGNINIGSRKNNGSIRFFTSRDDTQASFDGNNLRAMISPDGLYVKNSVGIGLSAGTNTTLPEVPDTKLHIKDNNLYFRYIIVIFSQYWRRKIGMINRIRIMLRL